MTSKRSHVHNRGSDPRFAYATNECRPQGGRTWPFYSPYKMMNVTKLEFPPTVRPRWGRV